MQCSLTLLHSVPPALSDRSAAQAMRSIRVRAGETPLSVKGRERESTSAPDPESRDPLSAVFLNPLAFSHVHPVLPLSVCLSVSVCLSLSFPPPPPSPLLYHLVGLVVRRPPRERKIPGSNPACAGIFLGSSHTNDFKIGTPVATLPGAWRYRVSTGTGRPGVSIL